VRRACARELMMSTSLLIRAIGAAGSLAGVARVPLSCAMGGALLWWVAGSAGPNRGMAIVHVAEPDVVVSIGPRSYAIEGRRHEPIECELPAGDYTLMVRRDGAVLMREDFAILPGEDAILTACAPLCTGAARPAPAGPSPDDGLAASIRMASLANPGR
jgi:hypothetical protein